MKQYINLLGHDTNYPENRTSFRIILGGCPIGPRPLIEKLWRPLIQNYLTAILRSINEAL